MADELNPEQVVTAYYDACRRWDYPAITALMDPTCVIDEPSFLPYGQVKVVGVDEMHRYITSTIFKVFTEDYALDDMTFFAKGDTVVAASIWRMHPRFGGDRIDCHYHEVFQVKAGRIVFIRTFYHSVLEMMEAFDRARVAGVDLDLRAQQASATPPALQDLHLPQASVVD